jgi:hypothetical protein
MTAVADRQPRPGGPGRSSLPLKGWRMNLRSRGIRRIEIKRRARSISAEHNTPTGCFHSRSARSLFAAEPFAEGSASVSAATRG